MSLLPAAGDEFYIQLKGFLSSRNFQDTKHHFLVILLRSLEANQRTIVLCGSTERHIAYLDSSANDPDRSITNADTDKELREI